MFDNISKELYEQIVERAKLDSIPYENLRRTTTVRIKPTMYDSAIKRFEPISKELVGYSSMYTNFLNMLNKADQKDALEKVRKNPYLVTEILDDTDYSFKDIDNRVLKYGGDIKTGDRTEYYIIYCMKKAYNENGLTYFYSIKGLCNEVKTKYLEEINISNINQKELEDAKLEEKIYKDICSLIEKRKLVVDNGRIYLRNHYTATLKTERWKTLVQNIYKLNLYIPNNDAFIGSIKSTVSANFPGKDISTIFANNDEQEVQAFIIAKLSKLYLLPEVTIKAKINEMFTFRADNFKDEQIEETKMSK